MTFTNIQISEELNKKLEQKIKETKFSSIQEYVNYILEQVVSTSNNPNPEQAYTKDEEAAMKERLEEMGYV